MSCLSPIPAIDFGLDSNGKHIIRMIKTGDSYQSVKELFGDRIIMLPCGHCIECRKKRANDWALRCSLEAKEYKKNLFLTLTYDDEHLPDSPEKLKIDLQKFYRSLRDRGYFVRYFGCGERGEKGDRMHCHTILFGFDPGDLKVYGTNGNGDIWYTSDIISKVWNKGFVMIGEMSYESARYTAGYTSGIAKKTLFTLCSRKPPIGRDYYDKHKNQFYLYDRIEVDGKSCPVPRSFDNLAVKDNLSFLEQVKSQRRLISDVSSASLMFNHGLTLDLLFQERGEDIKAKVTRRLKL